MWCLISNDKIFNFQIHKQDNLQGPQKEEGNRIILNLLKACGVKEVLLAGLDGFMVNINENYSDPNLRRPVSVEQVERRNAYYKRFIADIALTGIKVTFVTPSKYEK